jgi:hypothetical protein
LNEKWLISGEFRLGFSNKILETTTQSMSSVPIMNCAKKRINKKVFEKILESVKRKQSKQLREEKEICPMKFH